MIDDYLLLFLIVIIIIILRPKIGHVGRQDIVTKHNLVTLN